MAGRIRIRMEGMRIRPLKKSPRRRSRCPSCCPPGLHRPPCRPYPCCHAICAM